MVSAKLVTPPVQTLVQLTITKEQAQALANICYRIGGDAGRSKRGLFSDRPDSILTLLVGVGICGQSDSTMKFFPTHIGVGGGIHFDAETK